MTLGRAFVVWIVGVLVLTQILISALVLRTISRSYEDELRRNTQELARVLVAMVAAGEALEDLPILAMQDLRAVEIRDERGRLVWAIGPDPKEIKAIDEGMIELHETVRITTGAESPRDTYQVLLLVSRDRIRQLTAGTAVRLLGATALTLAVVLVIGLVLVGRVVTPLHDLADHARRLHLSKPVKLEVPTGTSREVLELANAFSEMSQRLASQRQALAVSEMEKMEAVEALARGVAHDFNNLLTAMLLHLRLLEREPATHPQAVAAITELAEEGVTVVNELLESTRKQTAAHELLDLAALVRQQESVLAHLLPHPIELQLVIDAEPVMMVGNPVALRRVVLNLVLNARAAVNASGWIRVRVGLEADTARLEVADDGEGIPPEIQDQVFTPEFTLRPGSRGRGLGLAVVARLVAEHEGEISLDSAPGEGATFTILFPLARNEAPAVTDPGKPVPDDGREHPRVLVVADGGEVAAEVIEELVRAGFAARHMLSTLLIEDLVVGFDPHVCVGIDVSQQVLTSLARTIGSPLILARTSEQTSGEPASGNQGAKWSVVEAATPSLIVARVQALRGSVDG